MLDTKETLGKIRERIQKDRELREQKQEEIRGRIREYRENQALKQEEGDGKKHSVNVRILKKGEDYILRVRDDYAVFDPLEQIRHVSVQNLRAEHIGLRMIHSLAQEARYTCILKLNNLFVRI